MSAPMDGFFPGARRADTSARLAPWARALLLASPRAWEEVKRFARWVHALAVPSSLGTLPTTLQDPRSWQPSEQRTTRCRLFPWQRVSYPLDRPPSRVYNPAERTRPAG